MSVSYDALYGGLTCSAAGYNQHHDEICDSLFHAAKIGMKNEPAKFVGQIAKTTDRKLIQWTNDYKK
jgi:hypothetical protein